MEMPEKSPVPCQLGQISTGGEHLGAIVKPQRCEGGNRWVCSGEQSLGGSICHSTVTWPHNRCCIMSSLDHVTLPTVWPICVMAHQCGMPSLCHTWQLSFHIHKFLCIPLTLDLIVFPSQFPSLSSWCCHSHHHITIITLFSRSRDLRVPVVSGLPSLLLGYVDLFVTLYSVVWKTRN